METKQEKLNNISTELKKIYISGIVDKQTVNKFGKIGCENEKHSENRKNLIMLCEFIIKSSSTKEVIVMINNSNLFPKLSPERVQNLTLIQLKKFAEDTLNQKKKEELFFKVFKMGLEGELTREDLQNIINQALGEENGNN